MPRTAEEEARHERKKIKQLTQFFGYGHADNPFNDPQLYTPFSWRKKEEEGEEEEQEEQVEEEGQGRRGARKIGKKKKKKKSSKEERRKERKRGKGKGKSKKKRKRSRQSSSSDSDSTDSGADSDSSGDSSTREDDGDGGGDEDRREGRVRKKRRGRGRDAAAGDEEREGEDDDDDDEDDDDAGRDGRAKRKKKKKTRDKRLLAIDEIEKLRARRSEREATRERLEKEREEENRLREIEQYREHVEKESVFHVLQCYVRAKIRLIEGRERVVDLLARNMLLLMVDQDLQAHEANDRRRKERNAGGQRHGDGEDGNDGGDASSPPATVDASAASQYTDKSRSIDLQFRTLDVELRDAVEIVDSQPVQELEGVLRDVAMFREAEEHSHGQYEEYWIAVARICEERMAPSALSSAVEDDVCDMVSGKKDEELENIVQDASQRIRIAEEQLSACDTAPSDHGDEQDQGQDQGQNQDRNEGTRALDPAIQQLYYASVQPGKGRDTASSAASAASAAATTSSVLLDTIRFWTEVRRAARTAKVENFLREEHATILRQNLERLERVKREAAERRGQRGADTDEQQQQQSGQGAEFMFLNGAGAVVGATGAAAEHVQDQSAEAARMEAAESARPADEDGGVMPTSDEVVVSRAYHWQDKYRPRKPRFFNRVKTGYDWNKYNQTHYDHDNPPPKTVQGYKFNIFYPDLIDRTKTPTYHLEPAATPEFCIIRFHAGPPYEDIAFQIVNREWEYQVRRGFRCSFDRGILQLFFNFKRHRYRR